MTAQNLNQTRVVDPIMTTVAQQALSSMPNVGFKLFPRVPVAMRGGRILEFGTEDFRRYNIRRSPGSSTKRIQFGHEGKPFSLDQDALEGKVPFELMDDASVQPGVNLGSRAVRSVMRIVRNQLEIEQGEIATNAANYDNDHKLDLSGAQWTDDANSPIKDVDLAREGIADTIGAEPNVLLLSRAAFRAAKNNANIIDRTKHTSSDSITAQMLATLFDVEEVVVGNGFYQDDNGNVIRIWGNHAVLAYVALGSVEQGEPSYGYTYELDGMPMAEESYQDRNAKSWIYPTHYDRAPVLTGINAGFLLQNCA